jgi:hypothetical protein
MKDSMLRTLLALVVCAFGSMFASVSMAQAPATTATLPATTSATGAYYIEFRVAQIGAYGHSYVAYGRLNGRGQPAEAHYADLHPMGNYAIMAIGHILPVPANTVWDPDVLKLPVSSSYRRKLSAAEYQKLLAAVRVAKANKQPYWNAISNNCNHFVAGLAQAIGMRTPSDLVVSYAFVPALRDLNEGAGAPRAEARARSSARHTAPPQAPQS